MTFATSSIRRWLLYSSASDAPPSSFIACPLAVFCASFVRWQSSTLCPPSANCLTNSMRLIRCQLVFWSWFYSSLNLWIGRLCLASCHPFLSHAAVKESRPWPCWRQVVSYWLISNMSCQCCQTLGIPSRATNSWLFDVIKSSAKVAEYLLSSSLDTERSAVAKWRPMLPQWPIGQISYVTSSPVSTWIGDRQEDWALWTCVRWSVWTLICDRPSIYSRHRADTWRRKWINQTRQRRQF